MHSLPLPLIKSPYVSRNLIPVKEKKKGKESVFPLHLHLLFLGLNSSSRGRCQG